MNPAEALCPRLLIVAGPNGAGKTTVTDAGLAHRWFEGCEYINPDLIAQRELGDGMEASGSLDHELPTPLVPGTHVEHGRDRVVDLVEDLVVHVGNLATHRPRGRTRGAAPTGTSRQPGASRYGLRDTSGHSSNWSQLRPAPCPQ